MNIPSSPSPPAQTANRPPQTGERSEPNRTISPHYRFIEALAILAATCLFLVVSNLRCNSETSQPPQTALACQLLIVAPLVERDPNAVTFGDLRHALGELRRCMGKPTALVQILQLSDGGIVTDDPFGISP